MRGIEITIWRVVYIYIYIYNTQTFILTYGSIHYLFLNGEFKSVLCVCVCVESRNEHLID